MDTCTKTILTSKTPTPPNTRKHPLIYYAIPRAMPSLLVLFMGCKEEIHPYSSVCEAFAHTRFVKQAQTPFPLHNSPKINKWCTHRNTVLGLKGKHHRGQDQERKLSKNSFDCDSRFSRVVYGPNLAKMTQKHPQIRGEDIRDLIIGRTRPLL